MTDIQDLNQLCPSLGRIASDIAAVTDFKPPNKAEPQPEQRSLGIAPDAIKRCLTVRQGYTARANEIARTFNAFFDESGVLIDLSKKNETKHLHEQHQDIALDIHLIDRIIQTELSRAFPELRESSYSIDSDWTVWAFTSSMFGPGIAIVLDMCQAAEDHSASTTH